MAKKRKKLPLKGKRQRLGRDPEPEGVLEEPEVDQVYNEMRRLEQFELIFDNHDRRVRLKRPDGQILSFIPQLESAQAPLFKQLVELIQTTQKVVRAYKWAMMKLNDLHHLDEHEVMSNTALQKAYDDYAVVTLEVQELREERAKLKKRIEELEAA